MSTWAQFFGAEPTTDPDQVARIVEQDGTFGVVLNDLPLDGQCHPAELTVCEDGMALLLCCEPTNRHFGTFVTAGRQPHALLAGARLARSWGCSYMTVAVAA
jgi:hypothetical protein